MFTVEIGDGEASRRHTFHLLGALMGWGGVTVTTTSGTTVTGLVRDVQNVGGVVQIHLVPDVQSHDEVEPDTEAIVISAPDIATVRLT